MASLCDYIVDAAPAAFEENEFQDSTLFKEWFATMEEDDFDLELRFDNGVVTLHLKIREAASSDPGEPDTPGKKGCGGAASGGIAGLGAVLIAAAGFLLLRRSSEEEK